MKKVLIIILIAFLPLLLAVSESDAAPLAVEAESNIQNRLPEIENQLLTIQNNEKLNTTQKIKSTIKLLEEVSPFLTEPQSYFLVSKVENILFQIPDDINVLFTQLGFLSKLSHSTLWAFSISTEEFNTRFLRIANAQINGQQFPLTSKLMVNFLIIPQLTHFSKFDELDTTTRESYAVLDSDDFREEIRSQNGFLARTLLKSYADSYYKKMKAVFISTIRAMELRAAIKKGEIQKVSELGALLDNDFEAVADFIASYPKIIGDEGLGFLGIFLLSDEYFGNNENLIKKANLIISKYPKDEKRVNQLIYQSELYRKISAAYGNIGNHKLHLENQEKANLLLIKSGFVDSKIYAASFIESMDAGDYLIAKQLLDQLDGYYSNPNQANYDFFRTFIGAMRIYNQTALKNGNVSIEDTHAYFRSGTLLVESLFYEDLANGRTSIEDSLNYYATLQNSYYRSGDLIKAAFYARRYVNTLQSLRSSVNSMDNSLVGSFTEKHAFFLKRFANNFYEIGEIDAALLCLQIIKENEFFDYVRRSNLPVNFLSGLEASKEENDLVFMIDQLAREIRVLQQAQLSKSNSKEDVQLILSSISKKKKELWTAKQDLDNYLSNSLNVKKQTTSTAAYSSTSKLKENEVLISIGIEPNETVSYLVYPDKSAKRFIKQVDSLDVRNLILDINLALSKKSEIPKEKIEKLSNLVIREPIVSLKERNIKVIKIRAGDFFGFIPFGILRVNGKELGEQYVIELQGLGKAEIQQSDGLDINMFGASQGNFEFTKLPSVKTELNALMDLPIKGTSIKRKAYLDDQFTRVALMSSFKQNTPLVHIATHFKASGNSGDSSKMLMGDGSTMSLTQINQELPTLKTNLVTLSACDTGSLIPGSNKNQSNVSYEGLSNSFQIKGARNVISTLWSISDDATADFMSTFYYILFNNQIAPSQALAYTQNIFRYGSFSVLPTDVTYRQNEVEQHLITNIKKYSHPYYWGAFQISTIN